MGSGLWQKGFTLVETLVSLFLFSLGMVGLVFYSGQGIRKSADNNARAMAVYVATKKLESLYTASLNGANALKTELDAMDPDGNGVYETTVTGNSNRDSFTLKILEAVDGDGTNVLTSSPPWKAPLSLGVQVDYQGINGVKSVKIPLTLVVQ